MTESLQLKVEYENALRRITFSSNGTLDELKKQVSMLIGVMSTKVDIKYRDEENDLVTIGSNEELHEVFEINKNTNKILRFIIVSSPVETEETTNEPEPPFMNLARHFSDTVLVGKLQNELSSSILNSAITKIAKTYVDSKGDLLSVWLVVTQVLPQVFEWFTKLSSEYPFLAQLQPLLNEYIFNKKDNIPMATPATAGGQQQRTFAHRGVTCDGCSCNEDMKQKSFDNGHRNQRGFIRGNRYKSQVVHDFDLCETCKESGNFPDVTYGPFVIIPPPLYPERGGRGGRGCGGPWGRPGGHFNAEHQPWWRRGGEGNHHHHHHHGPPPPPFGHPPHFHTADHPQHDQNDDDDDDVDIQVPKNAETAQGNNNLGEIFGAFMNSMNQDPNTAQYVNQWKKVISEGASAFAANSSNNEDLTDLARALAESLKESEPKKNDEQQQQPAVKWEKEINQLTALGFMVDDSIVQLLEQFKGDLEKVCDRIVEHQ